MVLQQLLACALMFFFFFFFLFKPLASQQSCFWAFLFSFRKCSNFTPPPQEREKRHARRERRRQRSAREHNDHNDHEDEDEEPAQTAETENPPEEHPKVTPEDGDLELDELDGNAEPTEPTEAPQTPTQPQEYIRPESEMTPGERRQRSREAKQRDAQRKEVGSTGLSSKTFRSETVYHLLFALHKAWTIT